MNKYTRTNVVCVVSLGKMLPSFPLVGFADYVFHWQVAISSFIQDILQLQFGVKLYFWDRWSKLHLEECLSTVLFILSSEEEARNVAAIKTDFNRPCKSPGPLQGQGG